MSEVSCDRKIGILMTEEKRLRFDGRQRNLFPDFCSLFELRLYAGLRLCRCMVHSLREDNLLQVFFFRLQLEGHVDAFNVRST